MVKKLQCINASGACKELIKQGFYPVKAIIGNISHLPLKTCIHQGVEQVELHHWNKNQLSAFVKI